MEKVALEPCTLVLVEMLEGVLCGAVRSQASSEGRRTLTRARWARSAFPSTELADVRGFNFTNVLAPAEGLPPSTAHITQFVHGIRILLFVRVGVYRDLSMVPRLRRGRLAGRALSHPFILRGQNSFFPTKYETALQVLQERGGKPTGSRPENKYGARARARSHC